MERRRCLGVGGLKARKTLIPSLRQIRHWRGGVDRMTAAVVSLSHEPMVLFVWNKCQPCVGSPGSIGLARGGIRGLGARGKSQGMIGSAIADCELARSVAPVAERQPGFLLLEKDPCFSYKFSGCANGRMAAEGWVSILDFYQPNSFTVFRRIEASCGESLKRSVLISMDFLMSPPSFMRSLAAFQSTSISITSNKLIPSTPLS